MFNIKSISKNATETFTIYVTYKGQVLDFNISSLISKRSKDDFEGDKQFLLLNSYLEYKGEEYKEGLFNLLKTAYDAFSMAWNIPSINPLPTHLIHPILDYLSFADIFYFVKEIYRLPPPSGLSDVFDVQIERDARGSRAQTYIKDDYLELVALGLILKVAMCPIYNFADIKSEELAGMHKEYILFRMFKSHPIFNISPMVKLLEFAEKLIEQNNKSSPDAEAIRILEKNLPVNEIPYYIVSIAVINKVAISSFVDDNNDRNVITKFYNYVNNKLKAACDINKTTRAKTTLTDPETGSTDESFIESYRVIQDIDNGNMVEMNWVTNSIEKIIRQLPAKQRDVIDLTIVNEAKEFCRPLYIEEIMDFQITILSTIFKSIIDPRSLDYLTIDSIMNMFSVSFGYLWGINAKKLAIILTSVANQVSEDAVHFNRTTNKMRISNELKDELNYYFPIIKDITESNRVNIVEKAITDLANEIYSTRLTHLAPEKYVLEAKGNEHYNSIIGEDLKPLLAEFIIKNEEVIK